MKEIQVGKNGRFAKVDDDDFFASLKLLGVCTQRDTPCRTWAENLFICTDW